MDHLVDFSICEFIDSNMWFYTYNDFYDNRVLIKRLFNALPKNGKRFYMWYIYANTHMDLKYKNIIWDYLNGYDEYGVKLLNVKKFYKDTSM